MSESYMDKGGKNSVLAVDDEKSNLMVLNSILSPEYTVYVSKTGTGALEMAGKQKPDLILLDVLMPDMDGYEVIAALKKSAQTRDIPVIFCTGLGSVTDEERGMGLGAADYIRKPFSAETVLSKVRNQMRIANLAPEARQP